MELLLSVNKFFQTLLSRYQCKNTVPGPFAFVPSRHTIGFLRCEDVFGLLDLPWKGFSFTLSLETSRSRPVLLQGLKPSRPGHLRVQVVSFGCTLDLFVATPGAMISITVRPGRADWRSRGVAMYLLFLPSGHFVTISLFPA